MGKMVVWRGTGDPPVPSVGLNWVTMSWQEEWWQHAPDRVTSVSTSPQGPGLCATPHSSLAPLAPPTPSSLSGDLQVLAPVSLLLAP